jgi:replicative DNA helicase
MSNGKSQPQDIEAEQAVLGCILIKDSLIDIVTDKLNSTHFYKDSHSKIFDAMIYLRDKNVGIDSVTVINQLKQNKELKAIGGAYYITGLQESVITTANIESYITIVHEKAIARKMIGLASEVSKKVFDDVVSPFEILSELENQIYMIGQTRLSSDFIDMEELLQKTLEKLDAIHQRKGAIDGVSTGFERLDSILLGLQNTDLIVLAARPSMGKTALAINMACNAAKNDIKTGILSYEMSDVALTERIMYSEARIDSHRARGGFLTSEEWKQLSGAVNKIHKYPILINDMIQTSLSPLRSHARRVKARFGIDLLIIDYLQKIYLDKPGRSRNDEIGKVTTAIKALAKELKIPILLLSQLSRAVESRKNKRPVLSDLRESGNIEQDADVVIGIYRQDHYEKDESKHTGEAELEVLKQRNGPTGVVRLIWRKEVTRFENMTSIERNKK